MKLVITVDCGASMTKVVYELQKSSSEKIKNYFWMPPEIERISSAELEEYFQLKGWIGSADPIQQAYLKVEKNYCYVVGKLAGQFHPEDRVFQLKYENALYKILAAIGVVLQKHQVKEKKKIQALVGVLLPWDEYSDRKRFTNKLLKLLEKYQFRGQIIKIKATSKSIAIRPEGGGIYSSLIVQKTGAYFQGKRIGIVQFGHRNITGFEVVDGQIDKGTSPQIGWTNFLDEIIKNTSGLDRQKLLKAINQATISSGLDRKSSDIVSEKNRDKSLTDGGNEKVTYGLARTSTPNWTNLEAIKSLATARDPELRDEEIAHIGRSICRELIQYRKQVRIWLEKTFPLKLDILFFSGGAAILLLPVLEDFCNSYRRVIPSDYQHYYRNSNSFYFFQTKLEAEYGEYEGLSSPHIQLIGDKELRIRLTEKLNITDREVKELSLDRRFVDPYGIQEYLELLDFQGDLLQKTDRDLSQVGAIQKSDRSD